MMFSTIKNKHMACICLLVALVCTMRFIKVAAQEQENDDFDDSGFDDTGYQREPNREAEGTHHNPSTYSSNDEDLDDDDDVDETKNVEATVSAHEPGQYYDSADGPISMPIQIRNKRSASTENDIEQPDSSKVLLRKKRYSKKYLGPVYTYVKTDKHAHFKWGVKHKVGKHYG